MDIFIESFINNIFYLILLVVILFLVKWLFNVIYKAIQLYNYYNKNLNEIFNLKHGEISLSDLHNLTPNEFEHWCALFLESQGFINIEVSPIGPDGGKDIICYKNSEKFYVECKRYIYSSSANYKVNLEIAKKLVGAMEGDSVVNGIIITSGIITDEAIQYFKALPNKFNIEIYDGASLVKSHSELGALNLITNL